MAYNSDMEPKAPFRSAKEQFDKQAPQYDSQWNAWSQETLDWMLKASDCRPTDQVLDVATGTGFTALAFAPRVQSVIGVDVAPGMLAQARQRAAEQGITNVAFDEAPAEALPYPDATFSLVTCRIAAHHFLDTEKFLLETARTLKPGGALVLVDTTVPDNDAEAAAWQNAVEAVRDPSHVQNYTSDEWRQMTEHAGLTVQVCEAPPGGITIPLTDWLRKAGCTGEQSDDVRRRFAEAPQSARQAFQIHITENGETVFTWQRVLLKAIRGGARE